MDSNVIDILAARLGNPDVADGCLILGNDVRVQASLARQQEHPQGHSVMLALQASHDSLFPEGIDEIAVGVGETLDEAVGRAAEIWIDGTLPVIRELLNDGQPNPDVRRLDVAAANFKERKVFIWDMFLGPLQLVGLSEEEQRDEESDDEIFTAILDALTGVFTQRRLHWVKCSITRQPSDEIGGDCRLNNEPWQEGAIALHDLAGSWPSRPTLQIRRQFLLCRPTERRAPEAEEVLQQQIAAMEQQQQKSWWQFWK